MSALPLFAVAWENRFAWLVRLGSIKYFFRLTLQVEITSKLLYRFRTRARNTPFRRPSCQAREEKRKFSPTATSLWRRRQRSRTWATAQRALGEENGGRRYIKHDGMIASPVGSCLCCWQLPLSSLGPPLYCSAPHCPPLSLSLTRFDAFNDVVVSICYPILGEQPRHLGYRPVYVGFPYDL